jgi:hypothetical protein
MEGSDGVRDEFTAKGGTRFVQDSQLPDDVEVCPRGDWNDWSESVTIPLADLLEFHRHVESLKRRADLVHSAPLADGIAYLDMSNLRDPVGDHVEFEKVYAISVDKRSVSIVGVASVVARSAR